MPRRLSVYFIHKGSHRDSLSCEHAPSGITCMLLQHLIEVEIRIKLVCLGTGIAQKTFLVQRVGSLQNFRDSQSKQLCRSIRTSSRRGSPSESFSASESQSSEVLQS